VKSCFDETNSLAF
jgi:hypothetical protein